MSQSQAFGNYQKRKYIRSPKRSFYSPKGKRKNLLCKTPTKVDGGDDNATDNSQTSIFHYFSPTSESKRKRLTPESINRNNINVSPNTTFKRKLFYSKDERLIINISDDEDDNDDVTKFVLHIKSKKKKENVRKVPDIVQTTEIRAQNNDLAFSESCVILLDQSLEEGNTEANRCVQLKCERSEENLPQVKSGTYESLSPRNREIVRENLPIDSSVNQQNDIKCELLNENLSDSIILLSDDVKTETACANISGDSVVCLSDNVKTEKIDENLSVDSVVCLSDNVKTKKMDANLLTDSKMNLCVEIKTEIAEEKLPTNCKENFCNSVKTKGEFLRDVEIFSVKSESSKTLPTNSNENICDSTKTVAEKDHKTIEITPASSPSITPSKTIENFKVKNKSNVEIFPSTSKSNQYNITKTQDDKFHHGVEIFPINSPSKTPRKPTENSEVQSSIEISPTKSDISSEEVVSLVGDVDWWENNDFEEQINEISTKTPIKSVKTENKSLNKIDVTGPLNDKETYGENILKVSTDSEATNTKKADSTTNIGTKAVIQLKNGHQNEDLENDPLYYIFTSPPAKIAWNTIFVHSQYQKIYQNYMNLSIDEKRLYSRLFRRKYDWIRLENIKYDFIADVLISLTNLAKVGFVKFLEPENEDLSVVLNLMQLDEVKKACDLLLINKKGKKSDMVESVLKLIKSQPTLNFGKVASVNKMKQQVVNIVPKCIKLEENPRNLFMSFLLISTYPHFKSRDDDRLTILIDLLFKLNSGQTRELVLHLSTTQVFKSLAKFHDYEESVNLVDKLFEAKKEKKWDQATILILHAKTELILYLKNPDIITELEEMVDYMRKYTPGANYAYVVNEGIDVLKKDKTNTGISEAVECLVLLLSQNYFLKGRRASWHCELALMMERWKRFDEVFMTLNQGLLEDSLTPLGKLMLAQRCETLLKRKTGLSVPQKNELAQLSEIKPYRFSTNTIPAKAMPNVSANKKQMWTVVTENDRTYMGVEQVVRQHYMSAEGGAYTEGYHDEGRIIVNLALCVFWKIIYAPLEGMFHVRLQDRPLDWGSSAFYRNRAKLIRKFLECIGIEPFLKFCDYLFEAYKERSSGLPDLTLWNVNKNKCLFVEVKGPSDKLSPKQIIWLQKLNEFGIESEVCHVHTLHTGKRELPNEAG
uniref:Fanconi-associated nuclease n=1 Tax=Rhodnius prolixus TaxID=13249 RepID=T1HZJ8_RHOPR